MTLTALSLAYMRLVQTYLQLRHSRGALTIRPRDASIFASLGEIHRDEREYEIACQAYQQALTLDPAMENRGRRAGFVPVGTRPIPRRRECAQ